MKRKAIAVIGEGITEKYYIESLKGLSPFAILPRELGKNASSLKELEAAVKKAITDGYDEVYCLIDMDSKKEGQRKIDYQLLKNKYHAKTHGNKKKGIQCKVYFLETERCTELWFLYHFTNSTLTRKFTSYEKLEKELHKYLPKYRKTGTFFKSIPGLHTELTCKREPITGSLKNAVLHAKNSVASKKKEGRDYTYSELHILIEALKIPVEQ